MAADEAVRVRDWFSAHGERFGLAPGPLSCRPVPSPGGFDNRSFSLDDGRRRLHVKLGGADAAPGLLCWAAVHAHLEARHGAPPLLGVVHGGAIAGESVALVFDHVAGCSPDPWRERDALRAALARAAALHRDSSLAARLGAGAPRSCADDLCATYVRRLRADLEECGPALRGLPFLDPGFPEWAAAETAALEEAVRGHPAFAAPAEATVHGDLHAANLLVAPGRLWILDWDDLHAQGDGLLDATNLLRPLLLAGAGCRLLGEYLETAGDPAAAARVPLHVRAMLLDEVVDTLADHVAADAAPGDADQVRARKRGAHLRAMAAYRRVYGP